MYYTIFLLLLWLTHGTPTIQAQFTPWLIALIISVIADFYFHSNFIKKG